MPSKESKLLLEVAKAEYSALSDIEVAALLNANDVTVVGFIDPDDLLIYIHRQGLAENIRGRIGGATAADKALTNFMDRATIKKPIDGQHIAFQTGLNALDVTNGDGTLTDTQRVEIEALGNSLTSIGKQLGYSQVRVDHVAEARA